MKARLSALVVLMAALALTSAVAPTPAVAQTAQNIVVNFADRGLERRVSVESSRFARVGPVVRVQLTLANGGSGAVDFQYSAQWMDADGFEVRTNNRWEPATIDGNTSRSIDLLGNSENITSVIVNIRRQ